MARMCVEAVLAVADISRRDVNLDLIKAGSQALPCSWQMQLHAALKINHGHHAFKAAFSGSIKSLVLLSFLCPATALSSVTPGGG